jgi:bacillithiol biosynthesis deacetylase BshB1
MTDTKITLLALSAHPDDLEICCGGLLAKAVKLGHATGIVDLTRGELSSQGTLEIRAKETAAATKVLGISHRENLSLPDGWIGVTREEFTIEEQINRVVDCIRRLRPEFVLCPYWSCRHPDHVAASNLITRACFLAGVRNFKTKQDFAPHSVALTIYFQMRGSFTPSFIVDITEENAQKLNAIKCYKSQIERDPTLNVQTLVSSPLSMLSINARDSYYGAMIGSEFGEPYYIKQAVPMDDPVSFFRKNPLINTLVFPEHK